MTTRIKTQATTSLSLPTFAADSTETQIKAIPSITGWYEADSGVEQTNGFRWRDRLSTAKAEVLNMVNPLVVTGSHTKPAIQTGYGSTEFSGTERGCLRTPSSKPLLSTTGFTVLSVTRVPTVASGESATLGGYVWSCRGPAGNNTPGLNISGSTGDPVFRAGGQVMSNPGSFDLRDGAWHIVRCMWNGATISVSIDRNRQTASLGGATTAPDSTLDNGISPLFGCYLNSATEAVTTPFYGQTSALMFFSDDLTSGELATVEGYLSAKYGVTLV